MQVNRDYQPTVAQLLGETAAVTTLIAGQLKQPGRLTLQLRGNGPIPLLVMDCNEQLQMRGMARSNPVVLPAPVKPVARCGSGRAADDEPRHAERPPSLPELRADGRRQHRGNFRALPGAIRTTAVRACSPTAGPQAAACLLLQKMPAADTTTRTAGSASRIGRPRQACRIARTRRRSTAHPPLP